MDANRLADLKATLKEIIADGGFIPDQEAFDLFREIVPWPAVEVCLVNGRGELLLQRRHFTEWPGEPKIHDWYIPGGYMKTVGTIEEWCRKHLTKDGVLANFEYHDEIVGVVKWGKGEHPAGGFLLSLLCVCRLKGAPVFKPGAEGAFMFTDVVIPTAVPNHTLLQEKYFWWRNHNLHLFSR